MAKSKIQERTNRWEGEDSTDVGKLAVLLSTYIGSLRYERQEMHKLFQYQTRLAMLMYL